MNKELAEKKRKRKPQSSIEEILLLVDVRCDCEKSYNKQNFVP